LDPAFKRAAGSAETRPGTDKSDTGMPVSGTVCADHSALSLTLLPLRPLLDDGELTELCINRPGEAYIERASGWERVPLPCASFEWCVRLAKLIANATNQKIDAQSPLLSATLPSGERAQIVLPPATTSKTVAITLRRPANQVWALDELHKKGIFARTTITTDRDQPPDPWEAELRPLLAARDHGEFLRRAVKSRKNILVSGPTGSGKTTCTKALILEIPRDERLITIEDARELVLDHHPNHVRLYYSKDGQGQSLVTPKQLLQSCLRMRPDRILLAELREEAFDYLRNVNSGHPGSITSIHASSCDLAFEQLMLLVKESKAGQGLKRSDILGLVHQAVDVVIQVGILHHKRCVREIRYCSH
jgi:type IV secretion system protein VirB11